jgi:alkylation response protein AidB-like acyl-CoA dehydrogenase
MTTTAGLDRATLDLMLSSLDDFIAESLPVRRQLELDHEDVCPEETVRAMCGDELGVHLVFIPEEYGGLGGGAFDSYRVCERLARIDIGLATSVFATFLGSDPILVGATPEQRKEWLGRIAEQGILFAYGATEPEAGSDLGALTTTATPVEADGRITGYRLTGRKQWISNGSIADVCTVLALAPGGPSWFVVEKGTAGFSSAPPEDKHGIRLSNTAALFLDDALVPAENLVGRVEGRGLTQAQQVFGYTRVMVAAFGLGGGWAALDRAIEYSTHRVQGGAPLANKQGYTHKLIVPHAVRLEAARAFLEETATRIDAGFGENGALNTEGAIAKYLSTEAGNAAAEAAIQAHGGYGYTRPYLVEKIKRDVRITTIYEGTSEILEMTIARDRWQQHLKTAGSYYRDAARGLAGVPDACGGPTAALAFDCLAAVLDACRTGRLTRNQHVLLRLGELITYAECAAALARRAVAAAAGELPEKTDRRFAPAALAAISRVFARDAAMKVAEEGLRLVAGAQPVGAPVDLAAALPMDEVRAAQAGLLVDMDEITDALYGRVSTMESVS